MFIVCRAFAGQGFLVRDELWGMIGARGVFVGTGFGRVRLLFFGAYVVGGMGCVCEVCGKTYWKASSNTRICFYGCRFYVFTSSSCPVFQRCEGELEIYMLPWLERHHNPSLEQ